MSPFTAKQRQANACRPSGRCRELSITCAWTGPRPVRTAAVSHWGRAPAPTPSFILSSGWPGRGSSLSTSLSCPSPKCCALQGHSEEMGELGSRLWGGGTKEGSLGPRTFSRFGTPAPHPGPGLNLERPPPHPAVQKNLKLDGARTPV